MDYGYSGYAEIIVQGTNGAPAQPIWGASPMAEPYSYVSAGSFSGPAVPLSPDPLVAYRWPTPKASDGLQVYLLKPITVSADTNRSFANLQSLTGRNPKVTVQGLGSIELDFGQENAAWLEFDSPDLPDPSAVQMSISEYDQPEITQTGGAHNVKTLVPAKYGNTTGTNYYQVALYFVDWDNEGRRLAVDMFDASSLNLIAPDRIVTNFYGGKYLVYAYNRPAKFRIDHVWGDNAVLSGIFFDPAAAPVVGVPTLGRPQVSGGNLILTGTGGTPNSGYTWLSSTNLSSPAHWTTNGTGTLDGSGALSSSIPILATPPVGFFRLRAP